MAMRTVRQWISSGRSRAARLARHYKPSQAPGPPPNQSPFFHYNSRFDATGLIQKHARHDLAGDPDYVTNFLGVKVHPRYFPSYLAERVGTVEAIPIPANWHADISEWAAALRAVELSRKTFTVIELGCGWGCWLNNTGMAAKRLHRQVKLIGIEGDEGHIDFAEEATRVNGFDKSEVTLLHGIAAAKSGTALFPRQDVPGQNWGLEPVFGASDEQIQEAAQSGKYQVLPMISLSEIASQHERIDLLHIDIQGGEADLIEECLSTIQDRVKYILIGTHSREIEGRLFDVFLKENWTLEIERPAILNVAGEKPVVTVDGVQGWYNPKC